MTAVLTFQTLNEHIMYLRACKIDVNVGDAYPAWINTDTPPTSMRWYEAKMLAEALLIAAEEARKRDSRVEHKPIKEA